MVHIGPLAYLILVCVALLQNESTKMRFHRKSVIGFRDWLAENQKLSCFQTYIKQSSQWVSGSKNRYHVLAVPGKPLSVQAQRMHVQQRRSILFNKQRVTCDQSVTLTNNKGLHFNTDSGKRETENFIHILGKF